MVSDEELFLLYTTNSGDVIQVQDVYYSPALLMTIAGVDSHGNKCRVFVNVQSFELLLKVIPTTEKVERRQIGFHVQ